MGILLNAFEIERANETTSSGGATIPLVKDGTLEKDSTVSTFTANGSTPVVVADTRVNADSVILIGLKTVGGTPAAVFQDAVTPGTSFPVTINRAIYKRQIERKIGCKCRHYRIRQLYTEVLPAVEFTEKLVPGVTAS